MALSSKSSVVSEPVGISKKPARLSKRLLLISIGLLATLVATIGVWVPGIPTTPFLLIALWAFSSSSQRLLRWLNHIPLLRSALKQARRYEKEGCICSPIKLFAQVCAWGSFIFVTIVFQSIPLSLLVGLLALACSIFMAKTPTAQKDTLEES
jgi:uncharacterized protein